MSCSRDRRGRSMKIFFRSLFLFFVGLSLPSVLHAASFSLDTSVLGQVRENQNNLNEVPINGYLGLTLAQPSWHYSMETDMRLFRDFARSWDDYDLYQAVMHIRPIELLQIDFGRQFVNQGFSVQTMDGLQLTFMPASHIDVSVYSGVPRSVEIGDFNKDDGLLSGLSVGLKNISGTNARFHAAWRKNSIKTGDLNQNDSVLLGLNASRRFPVVTTPMLYGLIEYNATGKSVDAGTVGLDIYPRDWVALNAEVNYFDENRDTTRPTVMSLLTLGRIYSGRLASTWTIVPDWLTFRQGYSFQKVKIQNNLVRNGHILEASLQLGYEPWGLDVEPGYYFTKSYGGDLHGVRLLVHEQFTEKISTEATFDATNYRKVTNNNDNAYSTTLFAEYEVLKGLSLGGGFEYNNNAFFNRDVRGTFRIAYRFDHEI